MPFVTSPKEPFHAWFVLHTFSEIQITKKRERDGHFEVDFTVDKKILDVGED